MRSQLFETFEPVAPTALEAELAREASRRLASHLGAVPPEGARIAASR